MTTKRRDFLNLLGGTSLFAVAPFSAVARDPHPESAGHPAPLDTTFDMTWADRVKGKYRAAFDSPEISEGAGLFRAVLWCDEYKSVYGTARSEMSPVLVVRHEGIVLAMNDEYWKRFKVGKEAKIKTPEGKKWAEANPVGGPVAGTPEKFARYNIVNFIEDGGTVLACNLAFGEVVGRFMKEDKVDNAAARQRAIEHLIPGVVLQPSGVFAVLRAQEAGCRYIIAS
jgi:hypothetical protein